MNNHGDYQTGYDILLIFGDDGLNAKGPAFQFRDVNTVSDLNTAGADIPDTIGVGDDLLITARIDQHEEQTCLLLLEPIETEIRQLPQLHLRLTGEGYRGSTQSRSALTSNEHYPRRFCDGFHSTIGARVPA